MERENQDLALEQIRVKAAEYRTTVLESIKSELTPLPLNSHCSHSLTLSFFPLYFFLYVPIIPFSACEMVTEHFVHLTSTELQGPSLVKECPISSLTGTKSLPLSVNRTSFLSFSSV